MVAERNAHAMDDGKIDKKEAKEIKMADKRQQENRQRGVAGFKPYRTAKWMKEGIKSRLTPGKSSAKRERELHPIFCLSFWIEEADIFSLCTQPWSNPRPSSKAVGSLPVRSGQYAASSLRMRSYDCIFHFSA